MRKSAFGTIIQIGDILVSEDVVTEYFACDYEICKGRCCIEGDSGAPMEDDETGYVERHYPEYSSLMSGAGKAAVAAKGFFEVDRDGDIVTPLVEGSCECAFSHFLPGGHCLCAIERCGLSKPISCKLYPIRVTRHAGGSCSLNVHHWDICKDAFEKGRREGIKVYQFLKGPLTEAYGEDFYKALEAADDFIRNKPE